MLCRRELWEDTERRGKNRNVAEHSFTRMLRDLTGRTRGWNCQQPVIAPAIWQNAEYYKEQVDKITGFC